MGEGNTIVYDADLVDRLADKYGLCARAEDAHAADNSSHFSHSSQNATEGVFREECEKCEELTTTHTPPARAHISSAETSAVDDLWDEVLDEEGHDG
jgi:hypothetical protein